MLDGSDAPSCTYIYLDNDLHDHNLFQAICRTNRLDGDNKDHGYILDFKELFADVQQVVAVYNSDGLYSDADGNGDGGGDNNVYLKSWLQEGRSRLDEYVVVHEMIHLLEPTHNARFVALLSQHYPTWREARAELNDLPLTAEHWQE